MFAAACTAIAGLEPLEFVDPADAQAVETGIEAGGDSSLEATTQDGPIVDGGGDARLPTGCSFVDAEFCDDFDHGDPFSVRWSFLGNPQGRCSLATSVAQALSGTTSVRVESLGNEAGTPVDVELGKRLPSFQGEYSVSFDVLFKVAPTGGVFLLQGALTPTYGNNNDAVNPMIAAFPADGGGVDITAFNLRPFTGTNGELLVTVPLNEWTHVEASVRRDVDAAATDVRYRATGGPLVTRQIATEAPSAMPTTFVGISSGGTVVELFIDNVVMDTR